MPGEIKGKGFEKIIEQIGKKIEARPEIKELSPEIQKEKIKEIYLEEITKKELPAIKPAKSSVAKTLKNYTEPIQKAKILVKYALDGDLFNAISLAYNLNDPASLDAFHDIIVSDYIYKQLVEKGILKRI